MFIWCGSRVNVKFSFIYFVFFSSLKALSIGFKKTPFKNSFTEPKKLDVLQRFLYLHINQGTAIKQSASEVATELLVAGKGPKQLILKKHLIIRIKKLHQNWRNIKKSANKTTFVKQKTKFIKNLNTTFNIYYIKKYKNTSNIKNNLSVTKLSYSEISDGEKEENENDPLKDSTVKYIERNKPKRQKLLITPELTFALDRTKTSNRNAVHILAATTKAVGCDGSSFVLNRESFRKARTNCRKQFLYDSENSFCLNANSVLTFHWDSKHLEDINSKKIVNRLAVYVTGATENYTKLLGIPKIANGTGKTQSEAIFALIEKWKLQSNIQLMCFDTTASNSGVRFGACQLLRNLMGKPLFQLACRHHIAELVLSNTFQLTIESATSSPDITLFKKFRSSWEN